MTKTGITLIASIASIALLIASSDSYAWGISEALAQTPEIIPVAQTSSAKLSPSMNMASSVGVCRSNSQGGAERACSNHFLNCKAVQWGSSPDQIRYCS